MLIRLKKLQDAVSLTCIRLDGSVETQRTAYQGFFALHDLMHYAVETTLGFRRAFLGLMAAGYSFSTFADKADPRYHTMPDEALWAEHLVNILSQHADNPARRDPELADAWTDDINQELAASLREGHRPPFQVSRLQLETIFAVFDRLKARWHDVAVGDHLELTFPPEANA